MSNQTPEPLHPFIHYHWVGEGIEEVKDEPMDDSTSFIPHESSASDEDAPCLPDLPDGNLVVKAEGKDFKVNAGYISACSSILRVPIGDACAQHGPTSGSELPFIELPYPAQDVEAVLSSLYNCGRDIDTMRVMKFARLAGIMEVGYQEGFDILYKSALRRFQQAFTSDLTQWRESMGLAAYTNGPVSFKKTDAPRALKIARKVECLSVLPILRYLCCTLDDAQIVNGVLRQGYDEIVDEIPPVDRSEIVRAIWGLSQVNKTVAEIVFSCDSADDCLQKETCIEELLKQKGTFLEERDVIWSLHELMDYLQRGELSLCQNCTKRCHDHADMQLKDVWIQLPEVMRVPREIVPHWPYSRAYM